MQIHPTKVEMAKEENKEQEEQLESKTQCEVEETNAEGSKLEAFIKFPLAMVEVEQEEMCLGEQITSSYGNMLGLSEIGSIYGTRMRN